MSQASAQKPVILGTPTRDLAKFASQLKYEDIPPAAIEHAKNCILDHLGNVLYASSLPWCRILYQVIREEGGPSIAVCYGQKERVSVTQAGLYNGTAGHGFELDDLHLTAQMHPGSVNIPPPMAIAEFVGKGDAKEFLTSIVVGYEVSTRIGMAVNPHHFNRGYHPQGTIGPFGAAASAGRMLKLNTEQMLHAIGMAGSQSAGLMGVQEGAMAKSLQSGRACQSGILGALLAQKGFSGITNVLEASFGGFCTTLGGEKVNADKLTDGLGRQWEILNVGFKPYSTAGSIHTTLDLAKDLMEKYGLKAEDCERVIAHTTTMTHHHCGSEYIPAGVTAAQMNLLFSLASMLRYGDAFVNQFTEEAIKDPETIRFILQHLQTMPDEDLDRLGPEGRHAAWIEFFLKDGRRLTQRAINRRGSIQNPMSRKEVIEKFRKLTFHFFPDKRIDSIEQLALNIEQIDDIRELTRLLIKEV